MPSGVYHVTTTASNGLPTAPKEAVKAFRCASGFIVREDVRITFQDWRLVTNKGALWSWLKKLIVFPEGTEKYAEKAALGAMSKM